MQLLTCRLLPAAILGWIALSWLSSGTSALPSWMAQLGGRAGLDDVATMRIALGAMGSLALMALLLGSRPRLGPAIGRVAGGAIAFAAIASLSAAIAVPLRDGVAAPPLAPGAWALVAGFLVYGLADRAGARAAARMAADSAAGRPPRMRSPAWTAMIVIASLVAAFAAASRVDVARSVVGKPSALAPGTYVEMNYTTWPGRTIPDTGLARLNPMLTALTLEGRSAVVLYDPRCGSCHTLFSEYFSQAREGERVIAVRVPPNPDAKLLPSDQPEEVDCPHCTFLDLPPGKSYLVARPTLLVVEDGRVTCATEKDFSGCLGREPVRTAPAEPAEGSAPDGQG
ncbi:MAG: hypothetical protein FGM37_03560 [Phycisphaerales bacterium]|nr:hypothetical protein [Phycisphaerales bacterium]